MTSTNSSYSGLLLQLLSWFTPSCYNKCQWTEELKQGSNRDDGANLWTPDRIQNVPRIRNSSENIQSIVKIMANTLLHCIYNGLYITLVYCNLQWFYNSYSTSICCMFVTSTALQLLLLQEGIIVHRKTGLGHVTPAMDSSSLVKQEINSWRCYFYTMYSKYILQCNFQYIRENAHKLNTYVGFHARMCVAIFFIFLIH